MKIGKDALTSMVLTLLSGGVAGMLAGCQDSIDSVAGGSANTNVKEYRLLVDAGTKNPESDDGGNPISRALSGGGSNDRMLKWAWEAGEEMVTWTPEETRSSEKRYSTIHAQQSGKVSTFDGTVRSGSTLRDAGGKTDICYFYPGKIQEDKMLFSPVELIEGTDDTDFDIRDKSTNEKKTEWEDVDEVREHVHLNLTQQDGTVATIGRKFDYQWAKSTAEKMADGTVKSRTIHMQRLVSIWALRFASEGKSLTDIDSIYISNIGGMGVLDLLNGQFKTVDHSQSIVLRPEQGKKFSSAGGNFVYAAVLPLLENNGVARFCSNIQITVYAHGQIYMSKMKPFKFERDRVYHSNIVDLKKHDNSCHPYVEVNGVKWATGNFIHYNNPATGADYWGIAPAQWWIADYDQTGTGEDGVSLVRGSQNIYNYTINSQQLDLFAWGNIAHALDVTMDDQTYKVLCPENPKAWLASGKRSLSKLVVKGDAGKKALEPEEIKYYLEKNKTASQTGLFFPLYGDIAWAYTCNNHQKFRIPRHEELEKLTECTIIPAFCYTDKGSKVYGAYFSDDRYDLSAYFQFPCGRRAFWKYSNVTALVQTGQGLFLPITGCNSVALGQVRFRYKDSYRFMSRYTSGKSAASSRASYLQIGGWRKVLVTNQFNGIFYPIRPVWDSGDDKCDWQPKEFEKMK